MISEAQSRIQRENCRVKSENRLPSLDVFRGLAIICMLLVNSLPDFEHAYPLLVHSEWAGITLADLAFPGFIFAMGASGTFFFGKHQHEGFTGKFMLLLRRGFLLFALGIVINQFELLLNHAMHTAPEGVSLWQDILAHGRIMGILQRLGVVYFCGMLIVWWLKKERLIGLMAMLLLFVSSLGFHVYAPAEPFSPIDNISMMVDQAWPGQTHCYLGAAFDPEGLYGSLAATSSMLLGLLAGQRLTARRTQDFMQVRELFGLGGILLILGFGWSSFDIISKPLWTAPYALITSGLFMWVLALLQLGFMLVPDIMENIFCICRNFGRNALLMYILSELVQRFLWSLKTPDGELVYPWLWEISVKDCGSTAFSILLFSMMWILFWWIPARLLARRGILLRL